MKNQDTIIITGASRGIGKTMAILFAMSGYNVVINYNKSEKEAMKLYRKLKDKNLSIRIYKADVANRQEVDSMVAFCNREFGGIDILINNAGISQSKLFTDISQPHWDDMLKTNLTGVFNCSQSVVGDMIRAKKGKIINVSSIWGMVGASCEVHYCAAKAGVIGFTKALAKELGPSNIQVNCIAPGAIKTNMLDSFSPQEQDDLKSSIPLGRLGRPRDIAACALFLASKNADYITGQVISPNGGFVI